MIEHEEGMTGSEPEARFVVTITRMRFVHFWHLPLALWRFHKLQASARRFPGLLRTAATIAGPWTLVNISIWTDRQAMLTWSGHRVAHVDAVRWTYGRTREVWAAECDLRTVRSNSAIWDGLRIGVRRDDPTLVKETEPRSRNH